eukprot:11802643-Alexandrium_andersonii.AAC.1
MNAHRSAHTGVHTRCGSFPKQSIVALGWLKEHRYDDNPHRCSAPSGKSCHPERQGGHRRGRL